MDECKDSGSNDDYGSRYKLANGAILLPWYPAQTVTSEELGYEELNVVSGKTIMLPWDSSERSHGNQFAQDYAEASTSTSMPSSCDDLLSRYVAMGFPKEVVRKVIQENGESDTDHILETLLTYASSHNTMSSDHSRSPVGHFEEGSSSASTSASPCDNLLSRLVGMGFPMKIVKKVIKENGQSDEGLIVEAVLTYLALKDSSPECGNASECDDLPDLDNFLDNEEDIEHQLDKDRKMLHLIDMGFPFDEASSGH